jgi:hypothetical protein
MTMWRNYQAVAQIRLTKSQEALHRINALKVPDNPRLIKQRNKLLHSIQKDICKFRQQIELAESKLLAGYVVTR